MDEVFKLIAADKMREKTNKTKAVTPYEREISFIMKSCLEAAKEGKYEAFVLQPFYDFYGLSKKEQEKVYEELIKAHYHIEPVDVYWHIRWEYEEEDVKEFIDSVKKEKDSEV